MTTFADDAARYLESVTALLAATGDFRTTLRLMLHSASSTTERYARAAVDPLLVAALDRFTEYVRRRS